MGFHLPLLVSVSNSYRNLILSLKTTLENLKLELGEEEIFYLMRYSDIALYKKILVSRLVNNSIILL